MMVTVVVKLAQPRLKFTLWRSNFEPNQAATHPSGHHHAVMDALLDPQTGTYTPNQSVQGIENEVYIRLITPLGSYWADPKLGSRLHLLKREKDVYRVQVLARQYAEQALSACLRCQTRCHHRCDT